MPELIYAAIALAALGLILSIIALTSIRRMRREQALPRLSSKLSWIDIEDAPTGTIRLDIWNAGRSPVTIKKVHLLWQDGQQDAKGSIGFAAYDAHSGSLLRSVSDNSLHPCEGRTFILPPLPPSMMRGPAEAQEDRLWISITDGSGEVARIQGESLKTLLENYLTAP